MSPSRGGASGKAAWFQGASALTYGVIVAAVWLGCQVVQAPVAERAPAALALRLAPSSPEVLRRAAEGELQAGRVENASYLATESLRRAPFNVRALRVRGLAAARQGDRAAADEMLTLAGNWSLRDDPTHAWLVEQRLRQGNYASAFGHADTLARRRMEAQPTVFNLFTTAVQADGRALPALVQLMNRRPAWRPAYLEYLKTRDGADGVLMSLAIALSKTSHSLTDDELQQIYLRWLHEQRLPAVRFLREQLNRPPMSEALQDGDFPPQTETALLPFAWYLGTEAGLFVEIAPDDLRDENTALRVEYNGNGMDVIAYQVMLLSAGQYRIEGEFRPEVGTMSRLAWSVRCFETDEALTTWDVPTGGPVWRKFSATFTVPQSGCTTQRLHLAPLPAEARAPTIAWFDNLRIVAEPAPRR